MLASQRDALFSLFNSANSIAIFSLYNMYGELRSTVSTSVLVQVESSFFFNFVHFLGFQPYPTLPRTLLSLLLLDFVFNLVALVDKIMKKKLKNRRDLNPGHLDAVRALYLQTTAPLNQCIVWRLMIGGIESSFSPQEYS